MASSVENLGRGNFGALYVLKQLSSEDRKSLFARNIKGPKIWMLYKDVCDHSIEKTSALISRVHKDPSVKCVIKGKERNVLDYLND